MYNNPHTRKELNKSKTGSREKLNAEADPVLCVEKLNNIYTIKII
jgi:hypothetical protein